MKRQTKIEQVKRHLRKRSITSLQAFNLYAVTRLADIVHELRTRHGWQIATEPQEKDGSTFAKYSLIEAGK